MDKPSTSGNKEGFFSSPAVGSTRQKQKSQTMESPDIRAPKIRKIANEQNRESQSAPNSQTIGLRINDNPPASILTISQTNKSQVSAPTNVATIRDSITRAQMKQEKLRRKRKTYDENTAAMKKNIKREDRVREEIGERLNISGKFQTAVQERQADVVNIFAGFGQRQIQIKKKYEDVILNNQRCEDLREQVKAEKSKMEVNADRSGSKKNEVSLFVAEAERLDTQLLKLDIILNGVETKQKQRHVIVCRDQQRRSDEMKKIEYDIEYVQVEMDNVEEKNNKLVSAIEENSERKSQLLSVCETLRGSGTQRHELIQDSKTRIGDFEERQASARTKIEELKSASLAMISKLDVELDDYRRQIKEHEANLAEKSKKLIETKSSNEKLADSINENVNDIEKLEKISDSKNRELEKLRDLLSGVSDSNEDLMTEATDLRESLGIVRKLIVREKADFEAFATEDHSDQFEIEMGTKLADFRRQCKNKEDLISKLREESKAETVESSKHKAKLNEDIVKVDTELPELQKSKKNYELDIKKLDSELKKKSNESTQASSQCLKARHEKRVKEQTEKIETLRTEISAIEAEYELENKRMTERKRAGPKTESEEFKSEIVDLKEKISEAGKIRDHLKKRSKKTRIPLEALSNAVPTPARSSPLIGIISTRNKTPPAISTPENSPERAQLGLWNTFGFGNLSDESSINSSSVFDDAQRDYVKLLEANKTDAAKLSLTNKPKKN